MFWSDWNKWLELNPRPLCDETAMPAVTTFEKWEIFAPARSFESSAQQSFKEALTLWKSIPSLMVLQKLQAPKINNLLFKLPFQQFSNETGNTSPGITFERWNNLSNKYFALYTANSGIAAAFFQMIEMPFRFVSLPPFLMKKVRVVACHVLNNFHAERERERERET